MRIPPAFRLALPVLLAAVPAVLLYAQTRDAESILAERTAGCEVCRRMANDILPGEFVRDAHEIPCSECHHPTPSGRPCATTATPGRGRAA